MITLQSTGWLLAACLLIGNLSLIAPGDAPAETPRQSAGHYIEQLADDDPELRRRAAYLLGQIDAPPESAVPALAKALSDRQMETRWYAIDALGNFGADAAPAVPDIIKSLESELNDETVRRRGARTLGRIGEAAVEAVPVLSDALESEDTIYRVAAAAALWRINGSDRALEIISRELHAEDADTAFFAATTAAELPDAGRRTLLPHLVAGLSHEDADVRQAIVAALVRIGAPSIAPLSEYLQKSNEIGRTDAVRGLGMVIDRQRRRVLYNDATSEREFAAVAGPLIRQAFPALASCLAAENASLRDAATLALAQGGSVATLQLLQLLQSEDTQQKNSAAVALIRTEKFLPKQRPLPVNIQRVHGRIVDSLLKTLARDDAVTQRSGVRLFVALNVGPEGAAARPYLERALQTGDLATRRYADIALKRIENTEQ